jgi:hypothetical protein
MGMKVLTDFNNREALTAALLETVLTGNETPEAKQRVINYYDLLSLEDLKLKAEKLKSVYKPDESGVLTKREQYIRARNEKELMRKVKQVPKTTAVKHRYMIKTVSRDSDLSMETELYGKDYIKTTALIGPGLIGVVLEDGVELKPVTIKINRLINKLKYTGRIIIHGKNND